jgi:ferritin-like metal-binding protein YciE
MKIKNTTELFALLLNDLWRGTQRANRFFQGLVQFAQEPELREALEARVFLSGKITETLSQCFRLIGERPAQVGAGEVEADLEDLRNEVSDIESPSVRQLFIMARANHELHLRAGEYTALIAAADATGHYLAGALLESCLADELVLADRTRRLIRQRQRVLAAAA